MSRRKQARPIRVLEPEDALQPGLTDPAEPGTSILGAINENSCSVSDDDGAESEDLQDADPNCERQCRRCKADFENLAAYVAHKPSCVKPVDEEELAGSSGEEADDEKRDGGEVLKRRRMQDAENNNGAVTTPNKEEVVDFSEPNKLANMMSLAPLLNLSSGGGSPNAAAALATLSGLPGAAGLLSSSVTLETLQNTKVAVAQFAATALANCANNPAAMQELAVLQSTLFALQQQQVLQLNLIQQLQQQLNLNRDSKEGSPVSPASIPRSQQDDMLTPPSPPVSIPSSLPLSSANVPLQPSGYHLERERVMEKERYLQPSPSSQGTALPATMMSKPLSSVPRISMAESKPPCKDVPRVPTPPTTSSAGATTSIANSIIPPHPLHHQTGGVTGCSISATLADTIITNTEPFPSLDEPNSLEMLQRRAQEVLDSASQGLLAGNLADELAFRGSGGSKGGKNGDGKRGSEPFFKHRCRYCGKVFGSDSALQIHIRSHTGERPFKCNVCGSRFTTKGNLKVHFQRHTSKFPHIKMNPNPVPEHLDKYHPPLLAQLQQNNPSSTSPPLIPHPVIGSSLPPFPPSQVSTHPPSIPIPSSHHYRANPHPLLNTSTLVAPSGLQIPPAAVAAVPPSPQQQQQQTHHLPLHHQLKREQYQPPQDVPENLSKPAPRPSSNTSSASPPLHARVKAEAVYSDDEEADKRSNHHDDHPLTSPSSHHTPHNNDLHHRPLSSNHYLDEEMSGGGRSGRSSSRAGDFSEEEAALGGGDRDAGSPPPPSFVDATADETSQRSLLAQHAAPRHEQPENLIGRIVAARGNTTCNICFKTFACNSALEIHYRSHTKERPFKCTICDRGFSTKGNMKQHMLTHKIRDMPQHLFDTKKPSSRDRDLMHSSQLLSHGHHPASLLPQQQHHPPPMHLSLQSLQNCSNSNSEDGLEERAPSTPTSDSHISTRSPELGHKRSPPEEDLPMAKRPSGLHKHLCHVCNKNFSSSSALQIHMRTHTGDKPFKCTVCQKAFTTKGNLKVHMGTHMWNNGASRRGRRMSLDLPPIPMTPKDSEYLQRRPDLFYPYLATPFINGMQQKLNEISVIQSATPPGGLPSPPNKFNPGMPVSFHGLGQPFDKPLGLTTADASRTPSPEEKSSPLSLVRHASSPPAASAWDMHYRRLSSPADRNGSPPSTQQGIMSLSPSPPAGAQNAEAPQHRGESLVA